MIMNSSRYERYELRGLGVSHGIACGVASLHLSGFPEYKEEIVAGDKLAGELEKITFSDYTYLTSSLLAAGLALWGLMLFIKSRLSAFKMFERSVMVSLFLTQVFVFFQAQFWGLAGLIIYLLVYVALRFMIEREIHTKGNNAYNTGS